MLEQPGQANIDLVNFQVFIVIIIIYHHITTGKGKLKYVHQIFQIKLLRKLKKTVSFDKWERVLTRFTFTYSSEDGWELDRSFSSS